MLALRVIALHGKFLLDLFRPLKGDLARLGQPQRVFANDVEFSHIALFS